MTTLHPDVLWAQRADYLYVTIPLQDASAMNMSVGDELEFSCSCGEKNFACKVPLFGNVVAEESSNSVKPRHIEMKLKKKEEEWWPRLTKDKVKNRHIQIDWNRWKDEDEVDEAPADDQFGMGGMPGGMGGMPGMGGPGGMPGMGGMGGEGGMGGMDLSALQGMMGGMGGAGGAGGPDMAEMMKNLGGAGAGGAPDSDDEEEAHEEMPPLESTN